MDRDAAVVDPGDYRPFIQIYFFPVDRFAFFILRDTVISGIEAFGVFFPIKKKKQTVYNIIYCVKTIQYARFMFQARSAMSSAYICTL